MEESEPSPHSGDPAIATDWPSWAGLEKSVRDEADLSDDLRTRTLAAAAVLRGLLGDDWIAQVTLDHPILSLFWNSAEWTRVRLCELADTLTAINSLPGGEQQLVRVRREREAGSALLEIDAAGRALTHGCTVGLGPRTRGDKSCDLVLTSGAGRRLFVEITRVDPFSADAMRQQQLLRQQIYPIFDIINSDHEGGGRLLYWPTDEERDALVARAEAFWRDGLAGMERIELDIPGTLHLWCEPVRVGGPLPGEGRRHLFDAPLDDDPLDRTRRAVRRKVMEGQLPRDEPGMVLVRPPSILWEIPDAIQRAAQVVAAAISERSEIVAAILVNWGHSPDRSERRVRVSDTAELIRSPDRHIFVRQSLVVWNAARAVQDVDEMVELLA